MQRSGQHYLCPPKIVRFVKRINILLDDLNLPKFSKDLLQVEVRPVGGLDGHFIGQVPRHGLHKAVHPLQLPCNVHDLDGTEVFLKVYLTKKISSWIGTGFKADSDPDPEF
jgi:hypothetical protein